MSKSFLKVSLVDIHLFEGCKYDKNDIVCIVFLNRNCVDKLYFKYKDYQSNLALNNTNGEVQLIFQVKDTSELVGCITFPLDTFLPYRGKSISQWFTLFDSTEDDEFDGEIGENDEEVPRALITFRFEQGPQSTVSTLTSLHTADEKTNYLNQNTSNAFNILSTATQNISSIINPIQINDDIEVNDDEHTELKKDAKLPEKRVEGSAAKSPVPSMNQEPLKHRSSTKNNQDRNLEASERIASNSSHPVENKKSMLAQNEEVQNHHEEDISIGNLDGKMADLLTMLRSSEKKRRDRNETSIDMNSDGLEKRELLDLEIKKTRMLEEALKQAENKLSKHEKLYEDLESKSKSQFKALLEKNKALNEENYGFKQKITDLETEMLQKEAAHDEEVSNITQKYYRHAESDKMIIEKYTITVQNLEKLNEDLSSQFENLKKVHTREKELNKQLQKQTQENLLSNKESLELLKEKTQIYFEQIQTLTEEKTKLEISNSNNELKAQSLELRNQSVAAEFESCKKDLEKMVSELEEYRLLNDTLKKTFDNTLSRKDSDIISLRESLVNLEENLRKVQSENEFIKAEKNELAQELANLRETDYEAKVHNLEAALASSEDARKELQRQLQSSEERTQMFYQQQKEKNLLSQAYEEAAKESKDQIKSLVNKLEEVSNIKDQKEYEIVDMRLKLDQYIDLDEQNSLLKEKIEIVRGDNSRLEDSNASLRQQLFTVSADLIRQTDSALASQDVIDSLTHQMETLNNSLRIAFGDIKNMHVTLESSRRIKRPYELYVPQNDDQVDERISEFNNKNRLPISFVRVNKGVYKFGNRTVQIDLLKDGLYVRTDSKTYPVEEFVQTYGQRELLGIADTQNDSKQVRQSANQEVDTPSGKENSILSRTFYSNVDEDTNLIKDLNQYKQNRSVVQNESLHESGEKEVKKSQLGKENGSSYSPDKNSGRKRLRKDGYSNKHSDLSFERGDDVEVNKEQFGSENLSPIKTITS